jgi:ubiquinone/menaquinone biosynthesis C-methylase UbiE
MLDDSNQRVYTAHRIVQYYTQLSLLQPAEQMLLDRLQDQWPKMKMLDIGVGGGRTTQHFSQLVMEYVGIDYSTDMIAACQKRFSASPTVAFEVCDAREMSRFEDNSFDFILFSFNGMDYVSHRDRLKILQEVSRVGKPGGYFFFSSHNLQGIERQFNWKNQISFNPITTYVNLVMLAIFRLFNRAIAPGQLKTSAYALVKDDSHNFRLKTYYVRPQEQINQLEPNFSHLQIYSWKNDSEIASDELCFNADLWLYYLCLIQ